VVVTLCAGRLNPCEPGKALQAGFVWMELRHRTTAGQGPRQAGQTAALDRKGPTRKPGS